MVKGCRQTRTARFLRDNCRALAGWQGLIGLPLAAWTLTLRVAFVGRQGRRLPAAVSVSIIEPVIVVRPKSWR